MTAPQAFRPDFVDPDFTSDAVQTLRGTARSRFEALGFPNRSHEEWRFTPLTSLVGTPFAPAPQAAKLDVGQWIVPGCRRLVFVNGRLDSTLSDLESTGAGVTIMTLAQARAESPARIDAHLGRYVRIEDNSFAALNTAQNLEGAFVHIEPGVSSPSPLHIIYAATGNNTVTYPRTLIIAEKDATATIIESYVGVGITLTCPVTEIAAGPNATIRHIRMQEMSRTGFHLGALGVVLAKRSRYSLTSASLGAQLSRLDLGVDLAGEYAHASLDGLTMVNDRRVGDHHVRVEHAVPRCTSNQRFRSVLSGRSRAIFTGRIVVAENAQETDADQSSRSLVLSPDAVAFNNPQLEINADDVRCTHGSTVGQLDEEALFYLRARGIGKEQAESMLTLAFSAQVLDAIEIDDVRSRLVRALESFLEERPGQS